MISQSKLHTVFLNSALLYEKENYSLLLAVWENQMGITVPEFWQTAKKEGKKPSKQNNNKKKAQMENQALTKVTFFCI